MTAASKSIAKTAATTKTSVDSKAEISKGALVSMSAAGAVVGLWSFASLAGAMVMTGGPFSLAKAWFGAVAGM